MKSFVIPLVLSLAITCVALADTAEDTYGSLQYGTNTLKNVRVIQSNPVDILIGHETGYVRIPLQKLPEPLKAKYPYDERKASDYKRIEAEKARQQVIQDRGAVNQMLLAKEEQLRKKIDDINKELDRMNKEQKILNANAKGKGARSSERQAADRLRKDRLATQDRVYQLRDELKRLEEQRQKYGS